MIENKTVERPTLSTDFYCHVAGVYRELAIKALKEDDFKPVTEDQVEKWSGDFNPPRDENLSPYLVRGVV